MCIVSADATKLTLLLKNTTVNMTGSAEMYLPCLLTARRPYITINIVMGICKGVSSENNSLHIVLRCAGIYGVFSTKYKLDEAHWTMVLGGYTIHTISRHDENNTFWGIAQAQQVNFSHIDRWALFQSPHLGTPRYYLLEQAIVDNTWQVIQDCANSSLIIKDLKATTPVIRHIPLQWPNAQDMCSVPGEPAIILVCKVGIIKFNIKEESIVWHNRKLPNMECLTCDNRGRVFVVPPSRSSRSISVLSMETGR